MKVQTLESYLSEHPFLAGMKPEYLALLAGCARNARYDVGTPILRLDQDADEFLLIRHGEVSVEIPSDDGEPMVIQTIGSGEVLGWSWLFPPYKWRFDARATKVTRSLALDARCLRAKIDGDPRFGYDLLRRFTSVMTQRLEASRLQLLEVSGGPPGTA